MKSFRTLTMVMSICAVIFFSVQGSSAAELPDAPTIVSPANQGMVDKQLPVITGVAPTGTRVAVYIDDIFNGYATTVSQQGEVQSFSYVPFLALEHGRHAVMARAEDLDANIRSNKSATHKFTVELPYPTPTVIGKVVDERVTASQPWIVGLAPSAATVEVYVDGIFNGTVDATADESGVGNFAYRPYLPLQNGSYTVTAVAVQERADNTIRKSIESAGVNIYIPATIQQEVVQDVVIENEPAEISESDQLVTSVNAIATVQEQATIQSEEATDENVEQEVSSEETSESDAISEEVVEETIEQAPEVEPVAATEEAQEDSSEEVMVDKLLEEDAEQQNDSEQTTSQDNELEEGSAEEATEADEDKSANEEDKKGGASKTRKTIGWILLVIAAIIFFFRLRKRQNEDKKTDEVSDKKDEQKEEIQQQLELHVTTENKNIKVVDKEEEITKDKSSGFADPVVEADSEKSKDKS